jgi:tetratricopeptide (TPR) repeat protein
VLSEQYKVGVTYPVYILMTGGGEVIKRWTGYSGSSSFVSKLKSSLKDLASIDQRVARFLAEPTLKDALSLAKYFADANENLKAVEYYRKAQYLAPGNAADYSFEVFANTANAAWRDRIPFDDVFPTADTVLIARAKNPGDIVRVSRIMSRLARKFERTDGLSKYLQAAIDATAGSRDAKNLESHELAKADYALHVRGDTAEAIRIKKASQPQGWENDRDKFYDFAKWCLERKINLEEAEMYARRTVDLVYPGRIRARVLNTVAEICHAAGKTEEAVEVMRMAVSQHPENEYYAEQLRRFEENLSSGQ